MPSALYAISHIDTHAILGIVTCEQKTELGTDTAAWTKFCRELVGDKLAIGLGPTTLGALEIPVGKLAVDEVVLAGIDVETVYDNPYQYHLQIAANRQAGDGSPKELLAPSNPPTLALATNGKLTVTFPNIATQTTVFALFEGNTLDSQQINGPTGANQLEFDVATSLAKRSYAVLVMARGIRSRAQLVIVP